ETRAGEVRPHHVHDRRSSRLVDEESARVRRGEVGLDSTQSPRRADMHARRSIGRRMASTLFVIVGLAPLLLAQQAAPPPAAAAGRGRGQAPAVISPEILADKKVTFRIL